MKNKIIQLPSVFYHGTNFEFDAFDDRHLGRAVKNPTIEFGFYFAADPADALSWAFRHQERYGPKNAILLEVELDVKKLKWVSAPKFNFYLQTARVSTIQRDRRKMLEDGYDGLVVVDDEKKRVWVSVFDSKAVRIVRRKHFSQPLETEDILF